MWSDTIKESVDNINIYIEEGNTIYLWIEDEEGKTQRIVMKSGAELKFMVISGHYGKL